MRLPNIYLFLLLLLIRAKHMQNISESTVAMLTKIMVHVLKYRMNRNDPNLRLFCHGEVFDSSLTVVEY
jgi:hypothetical protein